MSSSSAPPLYARYEIKGQTALVTGASSGIGEALVWRLAEAGCKVVAVARRMERLQELKQSVEARFGEGMVHCVTLDVRALDKVASLPSELPEGFADVDILVNNAGLARGAAPAHENVMSDVLEVFETNVSGVMAFTSAFVPGMVKRGRGHLVNIGSIAGHEAYQGGSVYCASKHAIDAFTTSARHDLAHTPIRVTAISPGAVRTEFSTVRYGDQAKADAVYTGEESHAEHRPRPSSCPDTRARSGRGCALLCRQVWRIGMGRRPAQFC